LSRCSRYTCPTTANQVEVTRAADHIGSARERCGEVAQGTNAAEDSACQEAVTRSLGICALANSCVVGWAGKRERGGGALLNSTNWKLSNLRVGNPSSNSCGVREQASVSVCSHAGQGLCVRARMVALVVGAGQRRRWEIQYLHRFPRPIANADDDDAQRERRSTNDCSPAKKQAVAEEP
jgi:hypothetical protein